MDDQKNSQAIKEEAPPPSIPRKFVNKSDIEILETYFSFVENGYEHKNAYWLTKQNLDISDKRIKACLHKAKVKEVADNLIQEVADNIYREKVPLAKEVVGLSLTALKEYLVDLNSNPAKKVKLTPQDAKALCSVACELNNLLRLELGEPTQNIAVVHHSYAETKKIFDELRQKDEIFDYPELPDIEVEDATE